MSNVKFAFWGTSDFSVFCLEEMKNLGIVPSLIITSPNKPIGRKLILRPNPVKIWAIENNIEFLTPNKLDSEFTLKLSTLNFQLFLVASYGKIIPQNILDLPQYGILNIHPSLLPKYRGASPLQIQIINDEKEIGFSLMLLDSEMDHGPLLNQEKVEIKNWPISFVELEKIMARESIKKLTEILPDYLQGKIKPIPQNHSEATFTKKIEKKDGELDIINGDPYKNYLKFLAYSEGPRVYAFANLSRHQNDTLSLDNERAREKIRIIITDAEFTNNSFIIKKVIPEGKKEMLYNDFLRGIK